MIYPIFTGKIDGGKLIIDNPISFGHYVRKMIGDVEITVKPKKKQRTSGQAWEQSNQNGYYWGVVIPIIRDHPQYMGWTPDQIHNGLKNMFLRIGGTDKMPQIRGSSDLDTAEWEKYMSDIRMWASDQLEMFIPMPNEVDWQ